MRNSFKVNTMLSLVDYAAVVNEIVLQYFDAEGEYQPHMGLFNTMRVFYCVCVKSSKYDDSIPHDFSDILEVDKLASDTDFINAFNDAIVPTAKKFDFANAYCDAMDIVEVKKNSLTSFVTRIGNSMKDIVNQVNGLINTDQLDKIESVAKTVSKNGIDPDKLIQDYKNSKAYKENMKENVAADTTWKKA